MKAIADCKVLAVDDSPENRMILECLLEKTCSVHTAADGADAIARARELRPDLILLDVCMPGMDGFSTCKALKASPETAQAPIIFLTTLADSTDKLSGFAAGGVDYITKPFDGAEICARVTTHLRLSLYDQEQRRLIQYLAGAVEETEETNHFFANHTADVVVQCSPEGAIRRINSSWVELTGLVGGLPLGRMLWEIGSPGDSETIRSSLLQAISERQDDLHLTFQISTVSGPRTLKGALRICYDHSGDPLGFNGVLTDVSELVTDNAGLESALMAGRAAAAAHLAYLENISHEIRTPLNALQGGLHKLREIRLNEDAERALKFVEQGASDLSRLFETILAEDRRSSRASSGVFHIQEPMSQGSHPSLPVLIVDDIKINRLLLKRLMNGLGFQQIDLAESGEEAIEIWSRQKHPLVLLDYQMGGIDGYETCRRIRRMPAPNRPTIVGVSATALPGNMDRALQAGFCAQIPKPVSKALIRQTLESLGWQLAPS
ncbi:MAG: response regulator [Verrucomicrobiae bacterium]